MNTISRRCPKTSSYARSFSHSASGPLSFMRGTPTTMSRVKLSQFYVTVQTQHRPIIGGTHGGKRVQQPAQRSRTYFYTYNFRFIFLYSLPHSPLCVSASARKLGAIRRWQVKFFCPRTRCIPTKPLCVRDRMAGKQPHWHWLCAA